jgi:DNA mismatch endonuclease (patch repair protein)
MRLAKLERGHNAPYWVAKIKTNVVRDRRHDNDLARDGWLVLRFWETDIARDATAIAARIATVVVERR